jgi:hypothetical protein
MTYSSDHQTQDEDIDLSRLNLILALVTVFVIGLAMGFLLRPQIIGDVPVAVAVTVIPNNQVVTLAEQSPAQTAPQNQSSSRGDSEPTLERAAATPTIMDFVLSDARHFLGSNDAPITLIEFSDFK